MDELKQKKQWGCRKCGSSDVQRGIDYTMPGDYAARLCDSCRDEFAELAPTLEWFNAYRKKSAEYEAEIIRYYGRTDVTQAEVAMILNESRATFQIAVNKARKHTMEWLDAEPVKQSATA